jgi:hypothetical protein
VNLASAAESFEIAYRNSDDRRHLDFIYSVRDTIDYAKEKGYTCLQYLLLIRSSVSRPPTSS